MGIKSVIGAACAALTVLTFNANAAIIDNGIYTTDEASGLDWLDLTVTDGQSFNTVSERIGSGGNLEGWAYATMSQFEAFMVHFGATTQSTCLIDETSLCSWSVENNGIVESVLTLMGDLSGNRSSRGLLLDDLDTTITPDVHVAAYLYDRADGTKYLTQDYISTYYIQQLDTTGGFETGSFLVRASVVPVPAAVWLFGSGLIGLIGVARRKKS